MSVCRHRIWMRQTLARRVFCGAGAGVYAAAVFSGHALSTGGVAGAAEDSLSIYGHLAHEMAADRVLSSRRGRRRQPHGRPAVLNAKAALLTLEGAVHPPYDRPKRENA
ncbi:hypothetical protein [Pseudoramibacter alactolyticus]|uniref:hypothetical protein n=1 Tax=Pseudoramibacter alactolyticus TaxID=113287 RepID=UPI0012E9B033|nr:hypothetical protein [Pseudoramibacter alactolyticus]